MLKEILVDKTRKKIAMAAQLKEQRNSGDPTIPTLVYVEFPKFNGSSVRTWIKKCEKCFSLCKTPEEQKVDLASFCMIDKSGRWVSIYLSNKRNVEWSAFVIDLCDRFRATIGWDMEEEEFKKWEDSLENYIIECGSFFQKDVVMEKKDQEIMCLLKN